MVYCTLICVKPYQVGTGHEIKVGEQFQASTKQTAEDLINSGFFKLPKIDREETLRKDIELHQLRGEKDDAREITVDHILSKHQIKTFKDTRKAVYYEKGAYLKDAEIIIEHEVEKLWHKQATRSQVAEITEHIKRRTYTDRAEFNKDINLLCLENGVLKIDTLELLPHSPKYLFTLKIPITYDPDAECPVIDQYLKDALHESDIPTFYELGGYLLYRDYPITRSILLVGGGGNGKTKSIEVLQNFIGEENKTSISLQSLTYNRFSIGFLYGKHANLFDDLPQEAVKNTGIFKMLTGKSPVDAEQKFGGFISFRNYAKMVFACNEVPMMQDNTDSFADRWVILKYDKRFRGTDKEDPLIGDKMSTPQELSGFLNHSLRGLKTLLARKDFTSGKSAEDTKNILARLNDSVKAFSNDMLIENPEGQIRKDLLYKVYAAYCGELKLVPVTNTKFTQTIKRHIGYEEAHLTIDGKRTKAILGYDLRTDFSDARVVALARLLPIYNIDFSPIIQEVRGKALQPLQVLHISDFTPQNDVKTDFSKNFDSEKPLQEEMNNIQRLEKPRDFKISVLDFLTNFDEGPGVLRSELEVLGSVDYQLSKEEVYKVLDRLKSGGRIFEVSENYYKINQ